MKNILIFILVLSSNIAFAQFYLQRTYDTSGNHDYLSLLGNKVAALFWAFK